MKSKIKNNALELKVRKLLDKNGEIKRAVLFKIILKNKKWIKGVIVGDYDIQIGDLKLRKIFLRNDFRIVNSETYKK